MDDSSLIEKKLTESIVFEGKLISVEHWDVSLPDGKTALREVVIHPGAVAVVPLDENNMVTMVRQHRVVMDKVTWEIPAGKLNSPDEDPLSAAKRELEEETGLQADDWKKLTVIFTTPGFCTERIHLYLARKLRQSKAHPDEDEFVSAAKFPLHDLIGSCLAGTLQDSKSLIGLLMADQIISGNQK